MQSEKGRQSPVSRRVVQRSSDERKRGLTLLEMLLVLVILTVVATIAVESIEPRVDQSRFEATQQTIQNVDAAILAEMKNADGSHSDTGFLADMGRLPQARQLDGALTLSELWFNPGVAGFGVRKADGVEGGVPSGQEDAEILVASGWNGPYLHLPVGAESLTDGWGTRLANLLPIGTSYSYLRSRDANSNEVDVMAEGDAIYGVRSLGRNNFADVADTGYDRALPGQIFFTNARISGVVTGNITIDGNPPTGEPIVVQLYGPHETTGLIRADRFPRAGFSDANSMGLSVYTFDDADIDYNVKVGMHAIRAYRDTNGSKDIDASDDRSQIIYFNVRPGLNPLPDLDIVSS